MVEEKEFMDAVMKGDSKIVSAMLAEEPGLAASKTPQGLSAVLLAAYYAHPEIARLLAAARPDPDVFEAAVTGMTGRLKILVAADPLLANAVSVDGFQPLGLACFFGHFEAAHFLLEHGAQVNSPSKNAQMVMPLHSAAASRSLEIARLLLEHSADPNARQADDYTPLQEAAANGQLELVVLLLDHGADPNAVQKQGQTAVSLARKGGHQNIVEALIAHGARK